MSENNVNCYDFDEYRLDVSNYQLSENGEPISLTQKSFELLHFLVENRGRVLRKEELLDSLWEGSFVEEANLTQHIYMLRKALKQKEKKKIYIETIPKNGYRFLGDVVEIAEPSIQTSLNGNSSVKALSGTLEESLSGRYLENQELSIPATSPSVENRIVDEPNSRFLSKYVATILGGAVILSAAALFYLYYAGVETASNARESNKSFAVIPFRQIDGERDEKLGIGVADVLIARLANIEEITVSPTTSILRFADKDNSNLSEIGKKLAVDYVIAGTIQRDNGTVRVTTQLYGVNEQKQLWTETTDEQYSDIFTLQDNISEKIAKRISMDLDVRSSALSYKQYTQNIEAYQAYSMGLSYWSMHSVVGFEKAISQFKKAIDKDPRFPLAYAYLADSYGHTTHISHLMSPEQARDKGEAAAKKALELDPDCAEAMAALALIYASENRQKEAFDLMKRSLEIKPNDAHSRHRISWMYANKGQIEKAVEEMKIAQKLDPQSAYINIFLGDMLGFDRKAEDSIAAYRAALEIEPTLGEARWKLIKALEQAGLLKEAKLAFDKFSEREKESTAGLLLKSRIFAKSGKTSEAKNLLNRVLESGESQSHSSLLAQSYIALDEKEKAVEIVKSLISKIEDNIYTIKYEPNFDPIRTNSEFVGALEAKERKQGW